jgi:transcriptional regulator with XRE-family HTH domain
VLARDLFAANVRLFREARGMTQEQLADVAEVHLDTIWKIENGHREPKVTVIAKIARGLDVPLGPMFERHEHQSRPNEEHPRAGS